MSMCTKEEVREIVHMELNIQRGEFVKKFWYVIIGMVFTTASAWFSLFFQVQNLSQNAFTIQDGRLIEQQITNLQRNYERDLVEIKSDIRFIREKLER
jgi:hypothetical protein